MKIKRRAELTYEVNVKLEKLVENTVRAGGEREYVPWRRDGYPST